jgi:hypothetical protein
MDMHLRYWDEYTGMREMRRVGVATPYIINRRIRKNAGHRKIQPSGDGQR